jgi:outer membrane protein TolC
LEIKAPEELVLPSVKKELKSEIIRPEIKLIDSRQQQLTAGENLISVNRMPKAFGFATLGYGNPPGSNFFVDEFDTYYTIGAGLKWNILDWNKGRNERKVLSLQRNMLDKRKEDLTDNISRQLYLKEAEIESLEKLIETDNELITIRKKITASAGSQHLNGTITATEYLNILNSEKQAAINSEIHLTNLALARVEYLNISGQDPE